MTEENNKAITHRFFEEVWNKGNLDAVKEFVSGDILLHVGGDEIRGPDGYMQFIAGFRNAFPDIQFTVEDQIAVGDKVVDRWKCQGTHTGELQGIPPTGKKVEITGIDIAKIVDDKMVERWGQPDIMSMMKQIGAIPPPKKPEP